MGIFHKGAADRTTFQASMSLLFSLGKIYSAETKVLQRIYHSVALKKLFYELLIYHVTDVTYCVFVQMKHVEEL